VSERFDAVVPDSGQVVTFENGKPVLPGQACAVGLELPNDLTFDQWTAIGSVLQGAQRSMMWWIGDWLHFGERKWGEMYADAVEQTGRQEQTLMNAKWVAGRMPISRRREKLSWGHHAAVAGAEGESEQDELLALAESDGLNVNELRREVRRRKGFSEPTPRAEPEPAPAPFDGPDRELALKLRDWLTDGRRMVATFKSGQVAALRCKESRVMIDPDRVDVVLEFLGVLFTTLTAEEQADLAA
jgi:hypothetical protein